jgi:hypothetical protein
VANSEHLATLKESVEAWNKSRKEHLRITPDLSSSDLHEGNLEVGGSAVLKAVCGLKIVSKGGYSEGVST